jgi:hypothetical protein
LCGVGKFPHTAGARVNNLMPFDPIEPHIGRVIGGKYGLFGAGHVKGATHECNVWIGRVSDYGVHFEWLPNRCIKCLGKVLGPALRFVTGESCG